MACFALDLGFSIGPFQKPCAMSSTVSMIVPKDGFDAGVCWFRTLVPYVLPSLIPEFRSRLAS